MTAPSREEEEATGLVDWLPFLLEDRLKVRRSHLQECSCRMPGVVNCRAARILRGSQHMFGWCMISPIGEGVGVQPSSLASCQSTSHKL